ncbi:hypothetical protein [Aquibacillus saliphilus]|uniref:hypothetical protein n=1 Tax=Aquibacillus saliphilus TaxID=1909422 RepID=UPI001CF0B54C|nr:hypothetical protein [Aquibacillus saliphilus]
MKKIIILILLIVLTISGTIYWLNETSSAKLIETYKIREQKDDFIVHIRVERNGDGFQILRSLQYIGSETITIDHRTPLTSVSINQENHDFTGSHVTKTLEPNYIYHPQEPESYSPLEKGSYNLYIHSQFFVDGEPFNVYSEQEIVFH